MIRLTCGKCRRRRTGVKVVSVTIQPSGRRIELCGDCRKELNDLLNSWLGVSQSTYTTGTGSGSDGIPWTFVGRGTAFVDRCFAPQAGRPNLCIKHRGHTGPHSWSSAA